MSSKTADKDRVFNVGVDLGTSRSSISAAGGERHVIDSYVGWPVDMVARKVLKRDVLIGSDALDNRIMLDLHRPLERGLIKEGSEKDSDALKSRSDTEAGAKQKAGVKFPKISFSNSSVLYALGL